MVQGSREEDTFMMPLDENERLLSLQVALKCADIGHLAAPLPVSCSCHPSSLQAVGSDAPTALEPALFQHPSGRHKFTRLADVASVVIQPES